MEAATTVHPSTRDIERLENTSFAAAFAAGTFDTEFTFVGPSDGDCPTIPPYCGSGDTNCPSDDGNCTGIGVCFVSYCCSYPEECCGGTDPELCGASEGDCTGVGVCFVSECCSIPHGCCNPTDEILDLLQGTGMADWAQARTSLQLLDAVRTQ